MNVESGKDLFLCVASHAELNAIVQSAMNGVSVKDCILYCTNKPCSGCLKSIINSGIQEVFYEEDYSDPIQQLIIERTNVKLTKISL
jgi:dCMP deaminase